MWRERDCSSAISGNDRWVDSSWLRFAGDQPGQRGWDRAVGPGGSGRVDVALEHGDRVAQDQNLGVLLARSDGPSRAIQPSSHSTAR